MGPEGRGQLLHPRRERVLVRLGTLGAVDLPAGRVLPVQVQAVEVVLEQKVGHVINKPGYESWMLVSQITSSVFLSLSILLNIYL